MIYNEYLTAQKDVKEKEEEIKTILEEELGVYKWDITLYEDSISLLFDKKLYFNVKSLQALENRLCEDGLEFEIIVREPGPKSPINPIKNTISMLKITGFKHETHG